MNLLPLKLFVSDYVIPLFNSIIYPIVRLKMNYKIMGAYETIDYIIKNNVSVSRYGDGEYNIIGKHGNGFQNSNSQLANRLALILKNPLPNHLICIPIAINSVTGLRFKSKLFWMSFVSQRSNLVVNHTNKNVLYGDSLFTRFYIIMKDKNNSYKIAEKIKLLWNNRDICIVEGDKTMLGIGNDLLDNAKSIKRVICPSRDAFDKYNQIRQAIIKNIPKETLVLCALGMTATVLSYDLCIEGYQSIDIGHVDLEYMWMKMKAKSQSAVPGKFVNEVPGGDNVYPESINEIYDKQIVIRI